MLVLRFFRPEGTETLGKIIEIFTPSSAMELLTALQQCIETL